VFDLDLWRQDRAGLDEQLDPDRFATWIEVLMETGPEVAADKLAGMDPDLVITALGQHILVFDLAAVTAPAEDGDVEPFVRTSERASREVGGFLVEAKRTGTWDTIVELLVSLAAAQPEFFQRVMCACRTLSNSGFELDGLDDLLNAEEQDLFDVSAARARRREQRGYLSPADARAFLQAARRTDTRAAPPPNPIARAYFRAAAASDEPNAEASPPPPSAPALLPASAEPAASVPGESPVSVDERARAMATVLDVLVEAGVLNQAPRGLLAAAPDGAPPLGRLHAQLERAREIDPVAWSKRTAELAFLANALVAGCTLQSRPFTPKEASDAAAAVCNLGLENWAAAAGTEVPALPDEFLVSHDLIGAFQICVHVSERLAGVLAEVHTTDPEIRAGLDALRFELVRSRRDGVPWRPGATLDALIILDKPAWAALVGLLAECPV
jgi:hypothetical protein